MARHVEMHSRTAVMMSLLTESKIVKRFDI